MLQRAIDRSSERLIYVSPVFVAPGKSSASGIFNEKVVNDGDATIVVFRAFDAQTATSIGWRGGDELIFVVETPKNLLKS